MLEDTAKYLSRIFFSAIAILFPSLCPLSFTFSFTPGRRLHRGGWGMKGGAQRKMSERGGRENNATPVWSVWARGREWHREGREKREERDVIGSAVVYCLHSVLSEALQERAGLRKRWRITIGATDTKNVRSYWNVGVETKREMWKCTGSLFIPNRFQKKKKVCPFLLHTKGL